MFARAAHPDVRIMGGGHRGTAPWGIGGVSMLLPVILPHR
ncbi:hypothetical protein F750_6586 [Streptomyces sp. PAMC 26508]|nr:hypothetical protein F750_6586 [Streptomyces sp. PAMC 26508]